MLEQLQHAVMTRYNVDGRARALDGGSDDGGSRGSAINAIECGSGEPLLLIHGGGANAAEWSPLLAHLQRDFRCVAVDRPGHGLSYGIDYRQVDDLRAHAAAFVADVLDRLDLPRATLVANSMGGFFALACALAHPERVDGLVLVGAPAGIDRWIPAKLRALSMPLLGPLLWKTVARPTPRVLRAFYGELLLADGDRLSDELVAFGVAAHRRRGADVAWLSLLRRFLTRRGVADACYLRDELSRVQVPTRFVWGAEDAFAPPRSGRDACAVMRDARLDVVAGAGHLPWLDAPEACADAIRRAVASLPAPRDADQTCSHVRKRPDNHQPRALQHMA